MSLAVVAKEFDLLASRFAFLAAGVQGVLLPATGVVLLAMVARSHTRTVGWAYFMLVLGGLSTVSLLWRAPRGMALAAALYAFGAAVVLFGGRDQAMVAGIMGLLGPSAVAGVSAWKLMMGGEAWAQRGVACAGAAVAVPLVVLALAAAGGNGLTVGLGDMGEGMGVDARHRSGPPCLSPPCGIPGTSIGPVSMGQVVAPLQASLALSAMCATVGLVVTRERLPRAVAGS